MLNSMTGRIIGALVLTAAAVTLNPTRASAGKLLDSLRNYDLNNYALGVHVSVSQSPYTNSKNSVIVYPYLTSFQFHGFNDDWLVLSNGDLGIRKVTESQWVFGVVGRIQTLGLGSERPDELLGLDERQWTVEVAPLVGYRGWPVHISAKPYKEISGRHGGWVGELRVEWPLKRPWGYIVPTVIASRLDETYANYYFGVSAAEAEPGRPEYTPGAGTNLAAQLIWGYQFTDKWLLSGTLSYEKLADVITDSPIVDKETLWSGGIGIAYNADIFQARAFDSDAYIMPRFEFRAGVFRDNISTIVVLDDPDGGPGDEIDLEDLLGIEEQQSLLQLDAIIRFNSFHRLEIGYFDVSRNAALVLNRDIEFGDEEFLAGTLVELNTDMRTLTVAYGFSLMHDAQKELGVMAGLHLSRAETQILARETGQLEKSTASTPLPVIGVFGSVSLGPKTSLDARVQIFRMHFDHYEGSMNYLNFGLQHVFGNHLSLGLGYNYYDLKLDSDHSAIRGRLEITHQGPFAFVGIHF
jgi:outer membrane scaffolding protein for murein synthesis (MipA/OmpV family)